MKKLIALAAALLLAFSAMSVYADDSLPLDGTKTGFVAGVGGGTDFLHFDAKPSVDKTYTVALPTLVANVGYGAENYRISLFGGVAGLRINDAFDVFGDAKDTVPVLGAAAKMKLTSLGPVKIGAVADMTYIVNGSDSAMGSIAGLPLTATLDMGPMVLWSAGLVAQYETKYGAIYVGEKYQDLIGGISMKATVGFPSGPASNSASWRLSEVDNLYTVAGIIVPAGPVDVNVQVKYAPSVPTGVTGGLVYHF